MILSQYRNISQNVGAFVRICRNSRKFVRICRNVRIFVGISVHLLKCQYICRNVRIFSEFQDIFRNSQDYHYFFLCPASKYAIYGSKMSEKNRSMNIVSGFVKPTKMGSLVAVLRGAS